MLGDPAWTSTATASRAEGQEPAALSRPAWASCPIISIPAKIILGDSGALFIGYVFATLSTDRRGQDLVTIGLVVPIVVLGLPILDTFFADRATDALGQDASPRPTAATSITN